MKRLKSLCIAVALFGFTAGVFAQTLQESVEARNKGAELMSQGDIDGAITALEKCVEISKQVGAEADENRLVAEGALPNLYLQRADKFLDNKDYPSALKAFDETITAAEKYNSPEVKEKAQKWMPTVYYAMGVTAYQANNLDEAIKSMDRATQMDPDMAKAYFIKGVSYQKQKNDAKMIENYQLAIDKGEASDDKPTAKNASGALSKFYYNNGINAMKQKKFDEAVDAFSKAVAVDNTFADAYYRMSSCYNNKKSWDSAITNAEKALELRGSADAKAKDGIYYELGTAYAGKKDNGKACEAFKKVTSEPFLAGAKYQIETALKCK